MNKPWFWQTDWWHNLWSGQTGQPTTTPTPNALQTAIQSALTQIAPTATPIFTPTATPTFTPAVMQNILAKVCGSQGASGIQFEGPLCLPDGTQWVDGKIPQMSAWNPVTFPGYTIYPSQYPGYKHPGDPDTIGKGIQPVLIRDENTGEMVEVITGKQLQAVDLHNALKIYPHVVLSGYSSGVHVNVFTAEMRMSEGLTSDLILVGPPVADPEHPVFAYDPSGTGMTEDTFVTRVQNLATQGNHILVIDDNGAGYFKYSDGFTNCGAACDNITYRPYNPGGAKPHELIEDLLDVANLASEWINSLPERKRKK